MRGFKFTFLWGKGKDHKLSKIDRFLVCDAFFNRWPTACLRALNRELSDHCPLLLTINDANYGPKPFRWFNSWLNRDDCEKLIVEALDGYEAHGKPDEILNAKFRHLRNTLKEWWMDITRKEGEEMGRLKEEIENLELILEDRNLEEEEEEWI